jgi:fumarate reductase flavoprotein subunit
LLDMRHLGEKYIDERLPLVRELGIAYLGVDIVKDAIPIRPVVHYMMGGISTNTEAATPLPGLFAAGECACVSLNGANRLGSNSLVELLVFGKSAAMSAIAHLKTVGPANKAALKARADESQARIRELFLRTDGTESMSGLRKEMMDTMEKNVGLYRKEDDLQEAVHKIAELRQRYQKVVLHDKSNVFNTDLFQVLELGSMLDCAQALTVGALARKESRGAHQRLDFVERDDKNYMRHSMVYYQGQDAPRLDYLDVVITKSPPGVRDYSGDHK